MREDTTTPASVFDELSNAAAASQSESDASAFDRPSGQTEPVEHELEHLLDQVNQALSTDEVQFNETLVKENLEEILLMLIALHDETHGKELLSDLTQFFDATLSPGTVYPALHDLNEADILAMHTKVRTKEYSIDDYAYVYEALERTMVQHLAFGLLLSAFLSRR